MQCERDRWPMSSHSTRWTLCICAFRWDFVLFLLLLSFHSCSTILLGFLSISIRMQLRRIQLRNNYFSIHASSQLIWEKEKKAAAAMHPSILPLRTPINHVHPRIPLDLSEFLGARHCWHIFKRFIHLKHFDAQTIRFKESLMRCNRIQSMSINTCRTPSGPQWDNPVMVYWIGAFKQRAQNTSTASSGDREMNAQSMWKSTWFLQT